MALPKFLTTECQKLLKHLLKKVPKERLGGGPDDAAPIKAHPWFSKYNMIWNDLLNKRIKPPYVPEVRGLEDVSMFDERFRKEPAIDSPEDPSHLASASFVDPFQVIENSGAV